jgi:spore germination cell wall hydrolase CwlJ-like protein
MAVSAAAFMLLVTLSPSSAQDFQIAEVQPASLPAPIAAERLTPAVADAAPAKLTTDVLAAYVARQQAQKGFSIFGDAPQPQLTSAMVSAYAATHYGNAALTAIDAAAAPATALIAPASPVSAFASPELAYAALESTVTDSMLAKYAHGRFVPTDKKVTRANQEKLCLTKAIYHEARGESDNGQWAVANVIINRAMSKRFPSTMCGVIYQNADQGRNRCQFSFACDGQPDMASERRAWLKANTIAAAAYSEFQHGQRPGVVPGSALFYHTRAVSPGWSSTYQRVAQIGAHVFYAPL